MRNNLLTMPKKSISALPYFIYMLKFYYLCTLKNQNEYI